MTLQRTTHSPVPTGLLLPSPTGVNRASLSNLAPVWSLLGKGRHKGWGDIWVVRWVREKVENQAFQGAFLHVLYRKDTKERLLRGRAKGDKGLCGLALLESLPEAVLVYVSCVPA